MSDQDRVHEASPIRLLKAREEGITARSGELSRSLVWCLLLGSAFLFIGSFQSWFAIRLSQSLQSADISWSNEMFIQHGTIQSILPLLVFLIAVALLALAAWHVQSPINVRADKAVPDLTRISPTNFWNGMLSASHWLKILILFLGLAVTLTAVVLYLANHSGKLASIARLDLQSGLKVANSLLRNTLIAAGVIVLVLGLADYVRERLRLAAKLRMSDHERREEIRNNEMNPDLRRRMLG